jgi:hypothetical protein
MSETDAAPRSHTHSSWTWLLWLIVIFGPCQQGSDNRREIERLSRETEQLRAECGYLRSVVFPYPEPTTALAADHHSR